MECFAIVTTLWVFSVCLHEFGHAWVAYRGGDYTVAEKGYLTMNPLRYTDPIFSLLIPVVFVMLGGIGLPGGAVFINRSLLRSRAWSTAVSLAGPAMNLSLIVLIGLLFRFGVIPADRTHLATISMAFLLRLQVCALLLNLLPIPPLDGFQALAPWMPTHWHQRLMGLSNVGMILIFVLLSSAPPVYNAFNAVENSVCSVFGVERAWTYLGYKAYRFWDH